MKYIEYIDTSGEIFVYNTEEFIDESWSLPFDFVLEQAKKNPEIEKELINQLFLRAKGEPFISIIKKNKCYYKLIKDISNGNDINKKIQLVLYYEPELLTPLFGNIENLIDNVISLTNEDLLMITVAEIFVKASTFGINDYTYTKIANTLETIANNEYKSTQKYYNETTKQYFPNLNLEKIKNNINYIKNDYINRIQHNKQRFKKARKLR